MSAAFTFPRSSARATQRGAALLVSMIMVLLVLMLAVAGMRALTVESRIAGNMLESRRLQETADGSLREGERLIAQYGISLSKCASNAASPVASGKPCFITEAKTDPLGLSTNFSLAAKAGGFENPYGYWYPRYVETACPKGMSATSALIQAETGCTAFYEVNAQATLASSQKECGPEALCLRSTVNLFIK